MIVTVNDTIYKYSAKLPTFDRFWCEKIKFENCEQMVEEMIWFLCFTLVYARYGKTKLSHKPTL